MKKRNWLLVEPHQLLHAPLDLPLTSTKPNIFSYILLSTPLTFGYILFPNETNIFHLNSYFIFSEPISLPKPTSSPFSHSFSLVPPVLSHTHAYISPWCGFGFLLFCGNYISISLLENLMFLLYYDFRHKFAFLSSFFFNIILFILV